MIPPIGPGGKPLGMGIWLGSLYNPRDFLDGAAGNASKGADLVASVASIFIPETFRNLFRWSANRRCYILSHCPADGVDLGRKSLRSAFSADRAQSGPATRRQDEAVPDGRGRSVGVAPEDSDGR